MLLFGSNPKKKKKRKEKKNTEMIKDDYFNKDIYFNQRQLTHFNKLLRTFMLFQFLRVFRLKKKTNKKNKTERHATCAWYLPADLIRPRTCLNEVDEKVTWPHKCSVDFFTDTHRLNDSTTMQCEKLW